MKGIDNMKENRGSITVEMCLIMPVVIGIVVFVIGIFLNTLMDFKAWGNSGVTFYSYYEGDKDETLIADEMTELINKKYGEEIYIDTIYSFADDGVIEVRVQASDAIKKGIYNYGGSSYVLKREYGKCTDRLRRWQLYGDVFLE